MNRIVLAGGDLVLATREKETLLYPVAPIDGGPIRLKGHYPNWGRAQWERLLHHARRLSPMYPGLEESLWGLESGIRKARIEKELPVVNEDRAKSPAFRAVHSLVLAHSRRGPHHDPGQDMAPRARAQVDGVRMGREAMDGGPLEREAEGRHPFCRTQRREEKLDPVEGGYLQCAACGRWSPEGKPCRCAAGPRVW